MVSYPYAQGDLITNPNTYFYASYGGRDFITAWRASRAAITAVTVPPPVPAPVPLPRLGEPVVTDHLLEALMAALSGNCPDGVWGWLDLLVKKFETTKRIHRAYDARFLAVDKSECRDLERYIRLAEVFVAAHAQRPSLVFLNVLLKLVDTLIAHAETLGPLQKARLAGVIVAEIAAVEAIECKSVR